MTPGLGAETPVPPGFDPQGTLDFLPDWLSRPVASLERGRSTLRPSQGNPQDNRRDDLARVGRERSAAMARGTALHLLLQHLPPRPPAERAASGLAFLAARHETIDPATHDALMAEALAVIAMPGLAALFGTEARAEVPLIGRSADGSVVSGTVDRLVTTDDAVIFADFKTGPPRAEIPAAHARQMALYGEILAPLWPGRALRPLLVWTAVPTIVDLSVIASAAKQPIG